MADHHKGPGRQERRAEALDERARAAGSEFARKVREGAVDAVEAGLGLQARLCDRYSAGNIMLIGMQRPGATDPRGFQEWKRLGRHVRAGERGIRIVSPVVTRTSREGAEDVSVARRRTVVFDIRQTEGAPVPERDMEREARQAEESIRAMARRRGMQAPANAREAALAAALRAIHDDTGELAREIDALTLERERGAREDGDPDRDGLDGHDARDRQERQGDGAARRAPDAARESPAGRTERKGAAR